MGSSLAKIIAASFAVAAPFVAGLVVSADLPLAASVILSVVGVGIGLAGLALFCSLDTEEEVAHLRRLNPDLRVGGEG